MRNYYHLIAQRISILGFIVTDLFKDPKRVGEIQATLIEAVKTGKLKADETTETRVAAKGIEEVPKIWETLFEGKNTGKLLTILSSE